MKKIIFIILFLVQPLLSQDLNISVKTNYTTTSRLYPDIGKSYDLTSDSYYSIDGIWGFGAEIRKNIYENKIFLGLSGEYVTGTTNTSSNFPELYYKDGYSLILFELSGYLIIPISSEKLKMYIGGGISSSYGERIREINGISIENVNNPVSTGIHVLTGLEYYFFKGLSLRWEMKFRDPEIETESKFNRDMTYKNITYQLPKSSVKSKINIDGIVFDFSLVYNFSF
jgi:hypothetical protein